MAEKLDSTAESLLVRARLAGALEQHEEAIRLYHELTDQVPEFEPRRITELAESLARAGRKSDAASQLKGLLLAQPDLPAKQQLSVLKKQAEWLTEADDNAGALEAYDSALKLADTREEQDRLSLLKARMQLDGEEKHQAGKTLLRLAMEGANRTIMKEALRALKKAGIPPGWSDEKRLERAERLIGFRDYDEALKMLSPIEDESLVMEAAWLTAKALYKKRGHYKAAIQALTPIAESKGPHADEARFLLARALSRRDRDDEAIVKYRAFATKTKSAAKATEARFLAARLEFYLGRHAAALRSLEHLVGNGKTKGKGRIGDPGRRRDAHFLAGLSALLEKKPERAVPHLKAASEGSSHQEVLERNSYWLAVAMIDTQKPKGVAALKAICEADRTSWYAHLAARRLTDLEVPLGPCEVDPLVTEPPAESADGKSESKPKTEADAAPVSVEEVSPLVALYYRAGLFRDAAEELQRVERSAPKRFSPRQWVTLYLTLESGHRALRQAIKGLEWPPSPENLWQARAAYPMPYEDLFRAVEERHSLPPLLLFAIARKESLFDPAAVSWVGAMGLMQMMPKTYEVNRKRAGLPKLKPGELPPPEPSIKAAGFEFAHLFERYDGSLVLAVMGYNAGTAAVDRWLHRSGDLPVDVFVEKAGFAETRNYIRRVVRTLSRYRQLAGEPMPTLPRIVSRRKPAAEPTPG